MVFKEIKYNSGHCTFQIFVEPKKSIEIHKRDSSGEFIINKFFVGDMAEYDSYNLSYYGKILSITEKSVIIEKNNLCTSRLSIDKFCWRNWDFILAEVQQKNSEMMRYI